MGSRDSLSIVSNSAGLVAQEPGGSRAGPVLIRLRAAWGGSATLKGFGEGLGPFNWVVEFGGTGLGLVIVVALAVVPVQSSYRRAKCRIEW